MIHLLLDAPVGKRLAETTPVGLPLLAIVSEKLIKVKTPLPQMPKLKTITYPHCPMIVEILLRSVVAMLLGGAIGIEREYRSKEAGFRTHFLVALGSALFCIVSQYGFNIDLKDSSRVAAQVVSGIGFGAGTIISRRTSCAV